MTQCSSSTAAAVQFTLLGFGAVVSEHDTMVEPLTVAFMNIGLTEAAFSGAQSEKHCLKIQRQVHELRVQHNVTMYCFVEVGAPQVGLTDESKNLFMQAVGTGASEHGISHVRFIWALKESLVVAFPAQLGRQHGCPQLEQVTEGPLLKGLYVPQPWRNSMQLFLDGPADIDRITIFLTHQPSSNKNKLSVLARHIIIQNLVLQGIVSRVPTEPPRFIIGGDLNTAEGTMTVSAKAVTTYTPEIVVAHDQRFVQNGDVVMGINMGPCANELQHQKPRSAT